MVYIILGAIIGACSRYAIGFIITSGWLSILCINILGSFVLALVHFKWSIHLSSNIKKMITTGFCGSFTTLSTFNSHVITLCQHRFMYGILYFIVTFSGSLLVIHLAKISVKRGV